MAKYFNRRNIILLLVISIFSVSLFFGVDAICELNYHEPGWQWCWQNFGSFSILMTLVFYFSFGYILLFTPTLITLPFSTPVFDAWKRFAVWAAPALLVLFVLSQFIDEGNAYYSFGFTSFILLVLYAVYLLASLVIIALAALRSRS